VLRLGYGRQAVLAVAHHGVRETTALLGSADAAEFLDAVAHAAPLTADQRHALADKLLDQRASAARNS
jgi:hypothetical protein